MKDELQINMSKTNGKNGKEEQRGKKNTQNKSGNLKNRTTTLGKK